MRRKIYLSKDFMREALCLPYDAIEDNIIDNTRWSIIHEIIFEYNNKFYRTEYSIGATEMQDECPWDYMDEVECEEVIQKPITVMSWTPVEENNDTD